MEKDIHQTVREGYATIAASGSSCCGGGGESSCCSSINPCCGDADTYTMMSKAVGYSDDEMGAVPEGANLGLGCGNPIAIASLKPGETVLDLGSGGGFDCFLAANAVGEAGHVIGVDMTPEMLALARSNAEKGGYSNVEFRLGEIEHLPVPDASVDVIISNCVINLSPEKQDVFNEAFRVLKPGGRLMVSDMVLLRELPDEVRESSEAYISCIAGAILKDAYIAGIEKAGFTEIELVDETTVSIDYQPASCSCGGTEEAEMTVVKDAVASVKVAAVKS